VSKLSKKQRDQLIMVAFGTVALMAALWLLVVVSEKQELADIRQTTETMKEKITRADNFLRRADEIEDTLQARDAELSKREEMLGPARDTYSWMVTKVISPLVLAHKGVNVPVVSQPEFTDVTAIPKFCYKGVLFRVKANGYFHDFGKFLADFENSYPYFRIQNLDMIPSGDGEKLNILFEAVALLQPAEEAK
jgi:hypothetical protein